MRRSKRYWLFDYIAIQAGLGSPRTLASIKQRYRRPAAGAAAPGLNRILGCGRLRLGRSGPACQQVPHKFAHTKENGRPGLWLGNRRGGR